MRKRHIVVLSEEERARLHTLIGRGVAPAGALTHARILLKANQGEAGPGWTDAAIAGGAGGRPGHRGPGPAGVRRRRAGGGAGPQGARARVPRASWTGSRRPAWSPWPAAPRPTGRKRWTLRLLAERLVELEVVETVSYETVRQALKQTASSRG